MKQVAAARISPAAAVAPGNADPVPGDEGDVGVAAGLGEGFREPSFINTT